MCSVCLTLRNYDYELWLIITTYCLNSECSPTSNPSLLHLRVLPSGGPPEVSYLGSVQPSRCPLGFSDWHLLCYPQFPSTFVRSIICHHKWWVGIIVLGYVPVFLSFSFFPLSLEVNDTESLEHNLPFSHLRLGVINSLSRQAGLEDHRCLMCPETHNKT